MVYVVAEVFAASKAQSREARLHAAAAQASIAKSQIVANVSHEVRTPLNGILAMADELLEKQTGSEHIRAIEVIRHSGRLLLSTINDLLDLSKAEAGQFSTEARPFSLLPVMETACALYSKQARDKKLALHMQIQPGLAERFFGDDRRLQQVLHNLVANAVKFTEAGSIQVAAKPGPDGKGLEISVSDTGPGIPIEAQDRIFEPFVQADPTVTRRYGGTGLGLAISRQISEALGGSLTVASAPSKGAVFHCFLPFEAYQSAEKVVTNMPPPSLALDKDWPILVADDNATNRFIMDRFLADTGADLHFVQNGKEAIEAASRMRFGIIFMDVQMPIMDGVTATRRIREAEAVAGLAPVPVIAVTANVQSFQNNAYREAGMTHVIGKPVTKDGVREVLMRFAPQRDVA
nr:ATP-binding protein [Cognatishimia sp. F0-27]